MRYGKNIYFTRVVVTLAFLRHQASHSQNKFLFSLLAQNTIIFGDKLYIFDRDINLENRVLEAS